jgi:hypothetical protein
LPSVGHLQRGGDDDPNDHNWDTQIKVACCANPAPTARQATVRNSVMGFIWWLPTIGAPLRNPR